MPQIVRLGLRDPHRVPERPVDAATPVAVVRVPPRLTVRAGVGNSGCGAWPHPSVRLQRALDQGNVFLAELAAREMPRLSLHDSLGLVVLYAQSGDPKFERASARWLTRVIEERALSTQQVALAANALLELQGNHARHGARLLDGLLVLDGLLDSRS